MQPGTGVKLPTCCFTAQRPGSQLADVSTFTAILKPDAEGSLRLPLPTPYGVGQFSDTWTTTPHRFCRAIAP